MSTVQTKIDYEYKVSGAARAAGEMDKVGDGANKASTGMNGATTSSNSMTGGLVSLASKAAIAAAAIDLIRRATGFLVESVRMAVDANEDMNKFLVVMGDNAAFADDTLTALANTTNRNVYELRALSAGLQDMLVPMGVERELASGLSTDFTRLATDLSSFNNVPVGEVMNALKSGLAGLSRPMRNFGVDLRMATVNQELLTMGIMGGYDAANTAERAQAIYNLTLKQSTDAQGDAARTADEAANVLVGFKSAVAEAQVEIGNHFLPVIETLAPLLEDLGEKAMPMVMQAAEDIANAMMDHGPDLLTFLGWLIDIINALDTAARKAETFSRVVKGVASAGITEYVRGIGNLNEASRVLSENQEILDAGWMESMANLQAGQEQSMNGWAGIGDAIGSATEALTGYASEYAASTGGGGRVAAQEEIIELLNEETLLEESLAIKRQAAIEMQMETKNIMFAKGMEQRQMELEQVNAQMEPLISAAQRSTDIIVGGLTGGFDSIKDGFKNMLADLAAEWAKSQIMKLLFSGGAKAATGGAGFFI